MKFDTEAPWRAKKRKKPNRLDERLARLQVPGKKTPILREVKKEVPSGDQDIEMRFLNLDADR